MFIVGIFSVALKLIEKLEEGTFEVAVAAEPVVPKYTHFG
tara:strand:+ start:588 stop:707 length:120 start_codon:yes stop_codon:yes gene_type:complete